MKKKFLNKIWYIYVIIYLYNINGLEALCGGSIVYMGLPINVVSVQYLVGNLKVRDFRLLRAYSALRFESA